MGKSAFRRIESVAAIGLLFWGLIESGRGSGLPPDVPTVLKAEPAPEWEAKFAGNKGWIGGDGVYSAVLPARRVLWLFGDTLLGEVRDGRRDGAIMVNNTIGLQNGHGKEAAINFAAGRSRDGKAAAFFVPADGRGWFWPQAAICTGGRLFIFLAQIDKTGDPGVFGFRQVGQWLAVIENPDKEPKTWRPRQHKLPFASFEKGRSRSWGSAVLEVDDYLYIYGWEERGKQIGVRRLTVARVPTKKLDDFTAWRFRTAQGWSDQAADVVSQADGLASEFSVSKMPGRKGYVVVYTENGLSDRILARFAAAPEGPWSAPLLLYRCPEMTKDKGLFSYAAKAHVWAACPDELLVSYCVNTWDFARLFREAKVYRPKFVRVRLSPAKETQGLSP
jgi:hypothetical protein